MEHEHKNDMMCEWCGRHKDGRYMWLRLVLAILIGVFIFLAGIEIGEMRGETYMYHGGHTTRIWHAQNGDMMWNVQVVPDGSNTTTSTVSPAHPIAPTNPAATTPANQ